MRGPKQVQATGASHSAQSEVPTAWLALIADLCISNMILPAPVQKTLSWRLFSRSEGCGWFLRHQPVVGISANITVLLIVKITTSMKQEKLNKRAAERELVVSPRLKY